jgi:chromate reductase, NAD(P)H dehydrogenase (quinone)
MSTRKIAVVVGSIRIDSINRKLAQAVMKLMPPDLDSALVRIDDLPVYNQDLDPTPPDSVVRLKAEIAAANALLFVTPEHNRSVPAALKNALDWASRPYGKSVWPGKPAGVMGASIGAVGTAVAQQHLRTSLAYLDVPTLGQPEIFIRFTPGFVGDDGNVASDDSRKLLQGYVDRYVAWVTKFG